MTGARAYISYRRADASGYAQWLRDRLARELGDESILMDVEPASATAQLLCLNGEFLEVLRASGVVIVVIGPRWFAGLSGSDDIAREEVAIALGYEAVRVIPLVVGGASLPSPDELPVDLRPLLERSALWLPESESRAREEGLF